MEAPLSELFFRRRMKMLSRPDGFMLYGKLGVDFFSNSQLLDANMKIRLRGISARPNFYMIRNNTKVSLGIVDCSIHICRIALEDDYHRKRMDTLVVTPVKFNYMEIQAVFFLFPARQNQLIQKTTFLTRLLFVKLPLQ